MAWFNYFHTSIANDIKPPADLYLFCHYTGSTIYCFIYAADEIRTHNLCLGYVYCEYEALRNNYAKMGSSGLTCVDGEDQDRHLIDMPHAAFAAVPPEHVADFMKKYGHLNLNWMQVGAKNADGYGFYDIVRGGMDKGVGLTDLCARLGLSPEEAVAAGDSANDLSMLRTAGLGVCMDNGTEDAKAAADRIIGDVREDGLAALIEELWFDGPKAEPSGRDLGSAWAQIESAGGQ